MSKLFTVSSVLFMTGVALSSLPMYADNSLTEISGAAPVSMSRDGQNIVGFKQDLNQVTWDYMVHKSFLWKKEGGMSWKTDYDGTDVSKSGLFYGVNNAGMVAGAMKDDSMRLPASSEGGGFAPPRKAASRAGEEEKGLPIFKAAVWRGGKVYSLDGGLEQIEAYEDETDGSYAAGISEDGGMVIGYTQKSYYPADVMGWRYNSASDEYEHVPFSRPSNAIGASLLSVSADGSLVFGNVTMPGSDGVVNYPAVWTSPDNYVMVELPEIEKYSIKAGAVAVSADASKMLVIGSGYSNYYMGIYNVASGELEEIKLPGQIYGVNGYAITDDGNIFLSLTDQNWTEVPYYYDRANKQFFTMKSYLEECASDISNINKLVSLKVSGVSGDGRNILFGGTDEYGMNPMGYLLMLDNPAVLAASAPSKVRLYHSAPDKVTCIWSGLKELPKGIALKGYEVYIDGNFVPAEAVTPVGEDFTVTVDGVAGVRHTAYVRTVYDKGGVEMKSAPSESAEAFVSAKTALKSFDNFDDCQLDGNGNPIYVDNEWQVENLEPNPLVVSWSLDVRDWDNNNPFAFVTSISDTPWSSAFVSRYHDATDAEDFYLSFYVRGQEVNMFGQDRSTDFLDVEVSDNGRDWKVLKSICARDIAHSKWSFYKLDLGSEMAGKVFQVRFNAHGEGKAQLTWAVDCIGINDAMDGDMPAGLRVLSATEAGVELTWQNTMSAWDVSHMCNSYVEADASAGNEGEPIMMAIDLKPEKLKAHVGEYIAGVSAFLYDDPNSFSDTSRVEAVVFEDGKEVARASFEGPFDTVNASTAWLSRPVKVESGKTYRLAVNLTRYGSDNAPMYYQNIEECVPGMTDLFSEDDGATWTTMREAYDLMFPGADQESKRKLGNCVWSIHADIVKSPEDVSNKQKDEHIIGYNVYRNGEQINANVVYAPYIRFVDENPLDKAEYTVQAFYKDGRVSPLSEPLKYDASSVGRVEDLPAAVVTVEPGMIRIAGEFDNAALYSTAGMKVAVAKKDASIATVGLPAGVYVLRVNAGARVDAYKIAVK